MYDDQPSVRGTLTSKLSNLRNGDLERRGKGSCGIQSPESQELGAVAGAESLITLRVVRLRMWILQIKSGEIIRDTVKLSVCVCLL